MMQHRSHLKISRTLIPLAFLVSFLYPISADTLQEENPFLPPGYGEEKPEPPKPVVQQNGPLARELEFRGIIRFGGERKFSVFNKSENKAYWLKENEMDAGIKVSGYDANSRSITVVKNGRAERLSLMDATHAPVPVATSVTMPKPGNGKQGSVPGIKPNNTQNNNNNKNVVPRRRVILPKK
jgi:hypothetical protein